MVIGITIITYPADIPLFNVVITHGAVFMVLKSEPSSHDGMYPVKNPRIYRYFDH